LPGSTDYGPARIYGNVERENRSQWRPKQHAPYPERSGPKTVYTLQKE
jgi:hypothetical protein